MGPEWLHDDLQCTRCGNMIWDGVKALHGGHLPTCRSAKIYDSPVDPSEIVMLEPDPDWDPFKELR